MKKAKRKNYVFDITDYAPEERCIYTVDYDFDPVARFAAIAAEVRHENVMRRLEEWLKKNCQKERSSI